jgi:hypothetical protein
VDIQLTGISVAVIPGMGHMLDRAYVSTLLDGFLEVGEEG